MDELAEVFINYDTNQLPDFTKAAAYLETQLKIMCRDLGLVEPVISARAKDPASVAEKVVIRGKGPLDGLTDRAGARVEVAYESDCHELGALIRSHPDLTLISHIDRQREMEPQEIGYLDHQFVVTLQRDTIEGDGDLGALPCEIQVRTRGQGAWSVVSHHIGYKDVELSNVQARQLNRTMALVEMIDQQFGQLRSVIATSEAFGAARLLEAAQRILIRRVDGARPVNDGDSYMPSLLRLYDETELSRFVAIFSAFDDGHGSRIAVAIANSDAQRIPLLRRPEAVVVLERLEHDPYKTAELWPTEDLPIGVLEEFSLVDGRADTVAAVSEATG